MYVLISDEGYRYTGMTQDLDLRLKQHNDKSLSFWTKRGSNWRIVYKEKFCSRAEAIKKEKWLKTGVGREWLSKLLNK